VAGPVLRGARLRAGRAAAVSRAGGQAWLGARPAGSGARRRRGGRRPHSGARRPKIAGPITLRDDAKFTLAVSETVVVTKERRAVIREVFLVQPIHPAGTDRRRAAGFHVRRATGSDMVTVAGEIGGAQAVVTRSAGLSAAAMAAAPRLRLVVVHGVGYDPVDVSYAAARGILVCN